MIALGACSGRQEEKERMKLNWLKAEKEKLS